MTLIAGEIIVCEQCSDPAAPRCPCGSEMHPECCPCTPLPGLERADQLDKAAV